MQIVTKLSTYRNNFYNGNKLIVTETITMYVYVNFIYTSYSYQYTYLNYFQWEYSIVNFPQAPEQHFSTP